MEFGDCVEHRGDFSQAEIRNSNEKLSQWLESRLCIIHKLCGIISYDESSPFMCANLQDVSKFVILLIVQS